MNDNSGVGRRDRKGQPLTRLHEENALLGRSADCLTGAVERLRLRPYRTPADPSTIAIALPSIAVALVGMAAAGIRATSGRTSPLTTPSCKAAMPHRCTGTLPHLPPGRSATIGKQPFPRPARGRQVHGTAVSADRRQAWRWAAWKASPTAPRLGLFDRPSRPARAPTARQRQAPPVDSAKRQISG